MSAMRIMRTKGGLSNSGDSPNKHQRKTLFSFIKFSFIKSLKKQIFAKHPTNANTYDTSAFFQDGFNQTPFAPIITVKKEGENYLVQYGGRRNKGFYHTKFIVRPNQYGRLIYNERGIYYTGEWYYNTVIYNFVNLPYSAYREKLFYQKEPNVSF